MDAARRRIDIPVSRLMLHAVTFVALALWSWRKWADPLVDFGRELYVPWQLTQGKVLYRDIAYLFGPFSQYLNALWFNLFGVSATTLIACNLAIFAATVTGIHYLFAVSCGPSAATVASMVVLLLFGFSQYTGLANYNFVCPYSHEATHSIALAIGMMVCLYRGARDARVGWFGLAGVCFGLVLLTKAETSLAAAVAAAAGLGCAYTLDSGRTRIALAGVTAFVGGALAPVFGFLVYFSRFMTVSDAARGLAIAWTTILTGKAARNVFYLTSMGFDDPIGNGTRMVKMFLGFALVVAAVAAMDAAWPQPVVSSGRMAITRRIARLAVLVVTFVALIFVAPPWTEFPRALPLISLSGVVVFAAMFIARRRDRAAATSVVPLVMWSVFSLVLLGKIVLNARIYQYGFFLAMPATVVLAVMMAWVVPRWLQHGGGRGEIFRAVATLVFASAVAAYLVISYGLYRAKDLKIGSGGDALLTLGVSRQWQGAAVAEALRALDATPRSATVAVVPEGVMINYLSRRGNPTPYINLMVPEVLTFGEGVILRAFETAPPDYIVLVHKDTTEYGAPYFGSDPGYGQEIMRWIESRYTRIKEIGRTPEGGWGIAILKASR